MIKIGIRARIQSMEYDYYGSRSEGGSRLGSLWFAITEPIIQMIREGLCDLFGHYYRPEDSYCDAENGSEGHCCCRCGYSIEARY